MGNKPSKEEAPGYLAKPSSDCCLKSTVHEGETSYRRGRDLHSKTTRGRGKRQHYLRVLFLTDDPGSATGLESKLSIYHPAAIALLYGEATPSHLPGQFLDDVAQNLTVIELRGKVHVTSDDTVEEHEAFVSATFIDGITLNEHVAHTIGSYENPLTADQLKTTKFLDLAETVIGSATAGKACVTFSTIVNATDVAEAVRLYRA